MRTTSFIAMQSLGKIVLRAPAVGAKIWCLCFLPAGCHGNLTVLNLLSASVTKNQHFRHCRKKYVLDRKMVPTSFKCHDVLYQHAKFGGDRTTHAGCRSKNWCFFCMSRLVCLRVGDIHVVQTSIVWRRMGRFWCHFQRLFQKGLLCQVHYMVLIYVARWRHNFREIAVKNYEESKNRRKSLCAPLRIDSWEIWRKFHRSSLWSRIQMCIYIKKFSTRRYLAQTAIVKIRIGSPKTARNEQVCVHQKSYRK